MQADSFQFSMFGVLPIIDSAGIEAVVERPIRMEANKGTDIRQIHRIETTAHDDFSVGLDENTPALTTAIIGSPAARVERRIYTARRQCGARGER